VSFLLRARLLPDRLPDLDDLCLDAGDRMGMDVELDEDTCLLLEQGRRDTSWCAWPRTFAGLFVPGASTRGVEVDVEQVVGHLAVRVAVPALCTWVDWQLGLALGAELAGLCDQGVQVEGEGDFLAEGLVQRFEDDDHRYLAECSAGTAALLDEVRRGRVVRVGGPAGYAIIGPRSWLELSEGAEDPEELALALVERIQASIELRGFEEFHLANPLQLDGPSGRTVVAAVLPPAQSTLLRDPQYVLLSEDLEVADARMWLLPFARLELAFPARAVWLDDRTAAIPAIPREAWRRELERIQPLLTTVEQLLDD
jgi:hypothetical protein